MASTSWFKVPYELISNAYSSISKAYDEITGKEQQQKKKPVTVPVGKPNAKIQQTNAVTPTPTTISIGQKTVIQNSQTTFTTVPQKKKATMEDFFSHYYTQYNKADENGKKAFIVRYFQSMAKNPVRQLSEFKRLHKLGVSKGEIQRLTLVIQDLSEKIQFDAMKFACTDPTEDKNKVVSDKYKTSRMVVADNYQDYHNTVQLKTLGFLFTTKDRQVINRASTHVSELSSTELKDKHGKVLKDKNGRVITNQTLAVEMFQNPDITGLDLKNKDDRKFQSIIDKNIIYQYSKFSANSQLSIHEAMSASKLSETVKYAASNIYNLDRTNQANAVDITVKTQNKEAIEAAAANLADYDKSEQSKIEASINNSGIETAKQILSAVKEFTTEVYAASSEKIAQIRVDTTLLDKTTQDTFAKFEKTLKNNPNPAVLLDEIKKLPDNMKLILLQQYSNDSVVVSAIFASGASLAVLSKLSAESINKIGYKNFVGAQICFLSIDAQLFIVNVCAENGTLGDIPRKFLKTEAKNLYDKKLLDETKKNETKKRYSLHF